MISVSSAFLAKINNGEIPYMRMQVVTANGRTIWLSDGQFWGNGVSFNQSVSQEDALTIGSAIISSFTFSLTNFDRTLDDIEWEGAIVIPFVYYTIDGANEYLPKGLYYVTSHTTSGNIVKCVAMDALKLLDQSMTSITYPTTVQGLVEAICTANGITLATTTIPNGSFVLNEPLDSSGNALELTDRQMLSYACQCIGCFATTNENGYLVVGWYDFDNPVDVTSTFNGKTLWTNPISVTGLRVTLGNGSGALIAMSIDENGNLFYMRSSNVSDTFTINDNGELVATAEDGVTYTIVDEELIRTGEEIVAAEDDEETSNEDVTILYGTDDRILKIENNPYITVSNIVNVCEIISDNIFSKAIRPGTLPILSNPCLQAGDVLSVTDSLTGTTYSFPITSSVYTKNLTQHVVCAFEDKENADLRRSSNYNMKVSVDNAVRQAYEADAMARAAQELAVTGNYTLQIVSDKGTAFHSDTTAGWRAVIYDKDMNEVDSNGTEFIYRWWAAKDSSSSRYFNGGKSITVDINDTLCDYMIGVFFETRDLSEGINPFTLAMRSDDVILTTRDGTPLTARAAERVAT